MQNLSHDLIQCIICFISDIKTYINLRSSYKSIYQDVYSLPFAMNKFVYFNNIIYRHTIITKYLYDHKPYYIININGLDLINLTKLYLKSNYVKKIKLTGLKYLKKIDTLVLSNILFNGLDIEHLTNLTTLKISVKESSTKLLNNILDNVFTKLEKIKHIKLVGLNNITNNIFRYLHSIESINIVNCTNITADVIDIIGHPVYIKCINRLYIHQSYINKKYITGIDIPNCINRIDNYTYTNDTFISLNTIKYLDCNSYHCMLSSIVFYKMKNLVKLTIGKHVEIDDSALMLLVNLERLKIYVESKSFSMISDDSISCLIMLKKLLIERCPYITNASICKLKRLKKLTVTNCPKITNDIINKCNFDKFLLI